MMTWRHVGVNRCQNQQQRFRRAATARTADLGYPLLPFAHGAGRSGARVAGGGVQRRCTELNAAKRALAPQRALVTGKRGLFSILYLLERGEAKSETDLGGLFYAQMTNDN